MSNALNGGRPLCGGEASQENGSKRSTAALCWSAGVWDAYSWWLYATCKLWFTHCNEFFWSVDSHIWFTPSMSALNMTRWFNIHSFRSERFSFVQWVNYEIRFPFLDKISPSKVYPWNTTSIINKKDDNNKLKKKIDFKNTLITLEIQLLERNAEMTRRWQMSIALPTQSGGEPHQIIPHLKKSP